ncbi:MAG: uracil-DNA glycosylase [Oscillospiraceae bacterium]|jgi:DNA polymerase|nr:uracil-DNA glycosylase [Oscillospiraceae bacterium]
MNGDGTDDVGAALRMEGTPPDWNDLEKTCLECGNCPLCDGRINVVFGAGPRDARILLIGEAPGEHEDKQGLPFVGKGGKFLDDMLRIIDLDRAKNVYIANMIKCRPPKNRDPLPSEQEACLPWLRAQYALLRPRIVVCLGRIAAGAIIGGDFKITRDHGKWFKGGDTYFVSLFHPAALLRDPRRRPETFVDLKNIRRRIWEICPEVYGQ